MTHHFNNHLENFLEMLAAERAAAGNTIISYRKDIQDYLAYLVRYNVVISEENKAIFQQYVQHLASACGLSAKSIARKISSVRQFYQFLVLEEHLPLNPILRVTLPKRGRDLPKSLAVTEIEQLLQCAAQDKQSKEGIRLYAMLEILYSTGLRISELVTLKLSDLQKHIPSNTLCEYIVVKGKGGKERLVVLNQNAAQAMETYLKVRQKFFPVIKESDWLFPSPNKQGKVSFITRQRFGQLLKDLAIKAGIDPSKVSAHKVRHTFASHMLQNGANLRLVQELLGHSDISTTQVYTKVLDSAAKNLVLDQHPLVDHDVE